MLMQDCKIGMRVIFGKENGQQTTGIVVKINGKKAKIRTDANRGKFPAGSIWSVPYSMLDFFKEENNSIDDNNSNIPVTRTNLEPILYSPFQDRIEQLILEAIANCYSGLSPENLSCDGEAPTYLINQKRSKLNRQLKGLFHALGREVDENIVYNWLDLKRSFKQ